MTKQLKADLSLLMITVFWGASYILTKIGLEALQPFNLTALRFLIAFFISATVFYKRIIKADIKTIKYSFVLGIILFSVFVSMTFGIQYTSVSNAGFLISLSVVLIPALSIIFLKQRVSMKIIVSVSLALIGIALLTLNSELRISGGDLLCILCALLYAIQVIATEVFTRSVDSIALGVLQLGFVGLFSVIFSALTETVRVPKTTDLWLAVLALSILCTAVGYIVQTTAQQYTSSSHTGLILSLESVFSAMFAFALFGEVLIVRGYIGAAILLLSVVISEFDFKRNVNKTVEGRI